MVPKKKKKKKKKKMNTVDSLILPTVGFLGRSMSGVLFSYASIIFLDFYFPDSKEPRETWVTKGSRKLRNLQYNKWRSECNNIVSVTNGVPLRNKRVYLSIHLCICCGDGSRNQ